MLIFVVPNVLVAVTVMVFPLMLAVRPAGREDVIELVRQHPVFIRQAALVRFAGCVPFRVSVEFAKLARVSCFAMSASILL